MFSDNENLAKPDEICLAWITEDGYHHIPGKGYSTYTGYVLRFDRHIDDDDVPLYFHNPRIIFGEYDIMITGIQYYTAEKHTGYEILINEVDPLPVGAEFTARIEKNNENIKIFLNRIK